MEDKTTPVEVLLELIHAYIKTSIQLLKLKATDKIAEVMSNIVSGFTILVIIAFFFVNLNIGIALLIGDLLSKTWLGFVLVSGLYACIGFIVYLFRNRWIKRPVSNSIIAQLLKDENVKENQ